MDVGASFVSGAESFELMEPGEAAFDNPADLAQSRTVRGTAAGDAWPDAACVEQSAVLVEVVATVGEQLTGHLSHVSVGCVANWLNSAIFVEAWHHRWNVLRHSTPLIASYV